VKLPCVNFVRLFVEMSSSQEIVDQNNINYQLFNLVSFDICHFSCGLFWQISAAAKVDIIP
jgi:hypothetical protein